MLVSKAPNATLLIRFLVGLVFLSEGIQKFFFPASLGIGRFLKIGITAPYVMAHAARADYSMLMGLLFLLVVGPGPLYRSLLNEKPRRYEARKLLMSSLSIIIAAGAVSGVLGGLFGNQGGIRSAAMLGLNVEREAFVATATGIALIVDVARIPIYLWKDADAILKLWPTVVGATLACVIGTLAGHVFRTAFPNLYSEGP